MKIGRVESAEFTPALASRVFSCCILGGRVAFVVLTRWRQPQISNADPNFSDQRRSPMRSGAIRRRLSCALQKVACQRGSPLFSACDAQSPLPPSSFTSKSQSLPPVAPNLPMALHILPGFISISSVQRLVTWPDVLN